jgi:hypothetical protein
MPAGVKCRADKIADRQSKRKDFRSDIFVGCVMSFVEVRQKPNRVLKRAACAQIMVRRGSSSFFCRDFE